MRRKMGEAAFALTIPAFTWASRMVPFLRSAGVE